jgi:succinyl-CoA synthetase beta subunit
VEIEEVARTAPEKIIRQTIDPFLGFSEFQGREIGFALGLDAQQVRAFTQIAAALTKTFVADDASLLEINPLAVTADGSLVGLDAKMVVDDNALYRHPELDPLRDVEAEDPIERSAREQGINYIKLDGTIGCVVNGAGLAMSTMDVIKLYGGSPANFLDIGGGANAEVMANALEVINTDQNVRSILINIFGGITRGEEVANGIVQALGRVRIKSPIVVRIDGTNAEQGRAILAEHASEQLVSQPTMLDAARKAVELAKAAGASAEVGVRA